MVLLVAYSNRIKLNWLEDVSQGTDLECGQVPVGCWPGDGEKRFNNICGTAAVAAAAADNRAH